MIYTRKDETYVIEVNGMPYHVIPEDEKYWSKVQDRLAAGEETEPEVPPCPVEGMEWNAEEQEWQYTLEQIKEQLMKQVTNERNKRIVQGFTYNGNQIACDEVSQMNANAFLTSDIAGLVTYPIKWRTLDNQVIEIADSTELKAFTEMMLGYVQTIFQESWLVKDNIIQATTIEEANIIYNNYIG